MKATKLSLIIAAFALLAFAPAKSWATCSGILLTTNNLGLSDVSICLDVTTTGTTTTVTLDAANSTVDSGTGSIVFANQLDWTGPATYCPNGTTCADGNPSASTAGWSVASNGGAADGFGKFCNNSTNPVSNCPAGGTVNEVSASGNTFGNGTTWEFNNNGTAPTQFAIHIGFQNCTGWFTNGTGEVTSSSGGTCSGEPVPEPGTLTLLGTGLLGIAGIIRRRLSA